MPFIPLAESMPTRRQPQNFPSVSADEQFARDDQAERLVRDEFSQEMPDDSRAALERDYRNRFGKEPPTSQPVEQKRGFFPLANADEQKPVRGFIPLETEKPDSPSLLKIIALENPATALGETVLNLGSQMVALPVAGWAGLATAAGNALGLTEKTGADVVHSVGEALTYQPRGEMGKMATEIATYPFQKLAEAGQYAGGKTLDATGSPVAATAVDTAINMLPMAIGPAANAAKRARSTPTKSRRASSRRSTRKQRGGLFRSKQNVPQGAKMSKALKRERSAWYVMRRRCLSRNSRTTRDTEGRE